MAGSGDVKEFEAHYEALPGPKTGRAYPDELESFHDIAPEKSARPRRVRNTELVIVLCLLFTSGAANFVLLKVLFSAYGEGAAFFVSQGINILYCIYGGILVYPRMLPRGWGHWVSARMGLEPITTSMHAPVHQRRFLAMGVMDCFGTFFTAMGAVYTPGQYQTLMNQSLIPATMLASVIFLGVRYSFPQLAAAVLIVLGAVVSIGPSLLCGGSDQPVGADDEVRLYAVLIYWLSNVPMACSAVYKEAAFSSEPMDVVYLTQWVSIWQMLFGFALAPLQMLPGVGTADGVSWDAILSSFVDGARCFIEADADGVCASRHTFLLLCSYVAVNFFFNTLGLWLTKHGGAVLNSISYALLLPLTTLVFSLPLLGRYQETAHAATFLGLVIVMLGFGMWRYYQLLDEAIDDELQRFNGAGERDGTRAACESEEPLQGAGTVGQVGSLSRYADFCDPQKAREMVALDVREDVPRVGFQERIVGMGAVAMRRLGTHLNASGAGA